jgi:hypothetical protein
MPTVFWSGPYRFFFYSGDGGEPMHVHVECDENLAKYWLDPVRLQRAGGFRRAELNRIETIIRNRHDELVRAWHEHFGG